MIVRAGDRSLHPQWIDSSQRDFDLFVSYYGKTADRYRDTAEFHEVRRGPKWPCLAALLEQHAALVARYDCIWLPDDDLAAEPATIDRMFAFFNAYSLCLAQPALTADSPATWRMLRQQPDCYLRFTAFVEVMAPMFSREALRACQWSFAESPSGWGLDWLWPQLCADAGLGPLAVIDATPVRHTRPVGGELYANHPELDPREDARRVLCKYGLQEARTSAKFSVRGVVRAVPPSLSTRLIYGLRRIHGRRKHRGA